MSPLSEAEFKGEPPQVVLGDMLLPAIQERVRELIGGSADVVLSDMSPKLTGIRFGDVARSAELVEIALDVASRLLRPGGILVAKVFPGQEANELVPLFRKRFGKFQRCALESSRKSSTELYFAGLDFRGAVSEIEPTPVESGWSPLAREGR